MDKLQFADGVCRAGGACWHCSGLFVGSFYHLVVVMALYRGRLDLSVPQQLGNLTVSMFHLTQKSSRQLRVVISMQP